MRLLPPLEAPGLYLARRVMTAGGALSPAYIRTSPKLEIFSFERELPFASFIDATVYVLKAKVDLEELEAVASSGLREYVNERKLWYEKTSGPDGGQEDEKVDYILAFR